MSNLAGYTYPGHVVEFAAVLGILLQHGNLIDDIAYYSNANNTGNVMDVLSWFAFNV